MEIFIGFAILLVMWFVGKIIDTNLNESNARSEKQMLVNSTQRDPVSIISFIRQDLRSIPIVGRERRLADNAGILPKYLGETFTLCQCAQFLAIDNNVLNLQIRGPLISAFKQQNGITFQEHYPAYKSAYLNNNKAIATEFMSKMGLSGPSLISIDPTYSNDRFEKIYQETRSLLNTAEMI